MPHRKRPYFGQKPILYFDENFPRSIIDILKVNRRIAKKFKITSVYDFSNENKDDEFQYSFANKKGYTLVTLDRDFMDDKKYPIQRMWGIILILSGRNQTAKITQCLIRLVEFVKYFPLPKAFMRDSKFQVSLEGCVMKGRDIKTKKIQTITITAGDTVSKIAKAFHFFG